MYDLMYMTYICCFFAFFNSVGFHKHSPDFIATLESMILNDCKISPFCLAVIY